MPVNRLYTLLSDGRNIDITLHVLELLGLVCNGLPCVHGLHAQYLIVALLIVEHGSGKVLEHVLSR